MDELLTVEEVAELQGIAIRTVQWQAQSGKYGNVHYTESLQRGGKSGQALLIPLSGLPAKAQVEYLRQRGVLPEFPTTDSDGFEDAPAWKREIAAKRLSLVKAIEHYVAQHPGQLKTELVKQFIQQWNASNPDEQVSSQTVYRWQKLYRECGRCGLLPDWGDRTEKQSIDAAALDFFKKMYFTQQRRSVRDCYRDLVDVSEEMGWKVPSLRTLERMVCQMPEATLTLAREGEEAFRNKCAPYIERDPDSILANQIWVSDHYRFDFFVRGQNGKPVRPWLTAWLDMRSWKLMSWNINFSPSTDTIMASFSAAALDKCIGLPHEIYTDNGRDYCSKEFAGTGHRTKGSADDQRRKEAGFDDDRVRTLVDQLGIIPHFAIPKNARAKVIERFFRIVSEQFCRRFPTYCGSDNKERPEELDATLKKMATVPTMEEVRSKLGDWATYVYNKMPTQGKGRKGECPDQTFERTRGPVRMASEAALRLCFMRHSQPVKVQRHGVTLFGNHYYIPDLIAHLGENVYLRYRDEDMTKVLVFSLEDKFLMEAHLKTLLPSVRADKDDIREAQRQAKRAKQITKEYAEISEAAAALPDSLDQVLARKKQKPTNKPEQPKVMEMVRIGKNLSESAEQLRLAEAVGGNSSNTSEVMKRIALGTTQAQATEERRIDHRKVIEILNRPK
ncbi:MAG: DNA-binding domain-containing protein [Negativicutes bacterium]|nr:DNA-binding domain-containing protein [Negativicutes bacterium]